MNILHIDSSILGEHSVSRQLSAAIVARLRAAHSGADVVYRDLVAQAPLPLSPLHLAAFQGHVADDPAFKADLAKGGTYIDDLFAADLIVVGAPMYNFTVAAQLKAWIDRVLVAGRTFRYTAQGPEGLLGGKKKVFLASSRGGVYSGASPAAALEHHETYLRGVFGFIGLTDVTVVRAEGVAVSPEAKQEAITRAKAEIAALAV